MKIKSPETIRVGNLFQKDWLKLQKNKLMKNVEVGDRYCNFLDKQKAWPQKFFVENVWSSATENSLYPNKDLIISCACQSSTPKSDMREIITLKKSIKNFDTGICNLFPSNNILFISRIPYMCYEQWYEWSYIYSPMIISLVNPYYGPQWGSSIVWNMQIKTRKLKSNYRFILLMFF